MSNNYEFFEGILRLSIPSAVNPVEAEYIHNIVLKYKPKNIIETGSGKSSLAILFALRENDNEGRLHSIDLPNLKLGQRALDCNKNIINKLWRDVLRIFPQWDIREKDICKELPILLNEVSCVDMFFHDSLHTEEHIFFEWNLLMASNKLVKGGLFGMHDRCFKVYANFVK